MTTTARDPREVLDELQERIRNGDTSVSAAEFAAARAAVDLATLQSEAEHRRAGQQAVEKLRRIKAPVKLTCRLCGAPRVFADDVSPSSAG